MLSKFECRKAIECFKKLSTELYNSCWVLLQIAKAHFELAEYKEANTIFQRIRSRDPHYTEGMEIYSTVLWHLQNEVDLSILAHELSDCDRNAPQTWCAVGNCFSLQQEHASAIKCFKRAIQLDKSFSYALTLSGHEYMAMEDHENAEKLFREAIHLSPRHYNAWYGLGSVSLKNGKLPMAKYHFQKAVGINPRNPVLLCCMGSILEEEEKIPEAVKYYTLAHQINPEAGMPRLRIAKVLIKLEKFEKALAHLLKLKTMYPREANISYLTGQVYESLGRKQDAALEYTYSLNLDTKLSNALREALERLHDASSENEKIVDI
ncbi:TPR-like protein [Basidiobolus meristosporus CBS 931.73]|uniref:TPR-like protein n=1 Tax=Basidiobolus meristosporus CBS 931.73 TaxID=1314790 RepID=A0A1Y1YYR9_9FUNG|nr:TPR-like protein [Basidiobolus meristosporus CBS 931.73]|eukprot:ORY03099.1 TPR-like protein [Basidiobolus meristosporus CBS 931.73]